MLADTTQSLICRLASMSCRLAPPPYTAAAVSDPVSTLPGEVRDGIDLVLSSGGRIAGNVRSQPDSEGVPGVLVVATDEDDGQLIATTDDDGAYEIDGVPAGTWRVTVWSVDHLATDIQTLSVVHGSTTALDFILDPGGTDPRRGECDRWRAHRRRHPCRLEWRRRICTRSDGCRRCVHALTTG